MIPRILLALGATRASDLHRVLRDLQLGVPRTSRQFLDRVTTAEIGRRAGFSDASHFVKVLRSRTSQTPLQMRRFWLHQANLLMNQFISRKLLGREPTLDDAPVILNEFANTASAGSIIAFHRHNADIQRGEVGVICSFGAGYSIGSVVVKKL